MTPALSAMATCPVIPELNSRHSRSSLQTSFFEWVQNLQNFRWTEEEVNGKLERGERALPAGVCLLDSCPSPPSSSLPVRPPAPPSTRPRTCSGNLHLQLHQKRNLTLSLSPEQRATHCRQSTPPDHPLANKQHRPLFPPTTSPQSWWRPSRPSGSCTQRTRSRCAPPPL